METYKDSKWLNKHSLGYLMLLYYHITNKEHYKYTLLAQAKDYTPIYIWQEP